MCAGCASRANTRSDDTFPSVYESVKPSVVLISLRVPPSDLPKAKVKPKDFVDGFGTGFVVSSGAWGSDIVTDAHVIEDGRDLHATIDERRKVEVRVVAVNDDDDLALLRTTVRLPALHLGHSATIVPGEAVGLAGFPIPDAFADEGLGTATSVKAGRVSSVRKDAIELDLNIIPGESGGPIFDAQTGDVIGIAESRFDEERAIGFATPIDAVRRFAQKHAKDFE